MPRLFARVRANAVPLVLVPFAALLVWVALWRVWLPRPGAGEVVGRTVTTVDADAASRPTHKVTTVVRTTTAAAPSRRSETLVIVLLLLGTGAAVVGLFHDRLGTIELDRTGIKVVLTKGEQAGAGELVGRLAQGGAGTRKVARGLDRYLAAVASARGAAGAPKAAARDGPGPAEPGLSEEQATGLARRIADEVG